MKKYAVSIKIALVTALAIILFQAISLFVVYQYVRLDLYLSLVAACFLITGWLLRKPAKTPAAEQRTTTPSSSLSLLTQREWQILGLIADGKTNKEIAATHFVELSTVKTHVNNIYAKLAVGNRAEARVKYAEMIKKES